MITMEELASGRTLAEVQGMTAELGRAVTALAAEELVKGRLDEARRILEGMAVTNPRDPAAWALLSSVLRRQGELAGARVCADAAVHLAPRDPLARLARAEALLACDEDRDRGRRDLLELTSEPGRIGIRARALLLALGA